MGAASVREARSTVTVGPFVGPTKVSVGDVHAIVAPAGGSWLSLITAGSIVSTCSCHWPTGRSA